MKTKTEMHFRVKPLFLSFLIFALPIIIKAESSVKAAKAFHSSFATSTIALVSPANESKLSLSNSVTFKWDAPNPAISGDKKYVLKVVIVENGQNAEQAIADNTSWLLDTTEIVTTNLRYEKIVNQELPCYRRMAWQVKAIDINNVEIASSSINTFYGPPFLYAFYVGNEILYVDTCTVLDMNNLSGRGRVTFYSNKTIVVNFNNIKVERIGALLCLTRGVINQAYSDSISIAPSNPNDGVAKFYIDTLYMTKEWPYFKGFAKCSNPNIATGKIISGHTAIIYDDYLVGRAYLKNQESKLVQMDNSSILMGSTSYFVFNGSGYWLSLSGTVTTVFESMGSLKDSITLAYNQVSNIDYIELGPTNVQMPLKLNEVVSLIPQRAILDLSDKVSPKKISDLTWKGVFLNEFNILFNNESDDHIVKLKDQSYVNIKPEASDSSKFLITPTELDLTVDTSFTTNLNASYNGFDGYLKRIKINRPLTAKSGDQILGTINIPYIQTAGMPEYVLNFDGTACIDSLVTKIEDFSFYPVTEKRILSFSVLNGASMIPATIDQSLKSITFTLPQNADITKVVSYFNTSGNKVTVDQSNQIRGVTENDFTNEITYTVTAGDGSQENYKVRGNLQSSISDISASKINVHPNPVTDIVVLENIPANGKVEIYSISGNLLKSASVKKGANRIDLADLPKGVYIIWFQVGEEKARVRIVKQ